MTAHWPPVPHPYRHVLVTDFDGTLARPDFYHLVHQHLVPDDTPNHWDDYLAGSVTHFDALRSFFLAAEGGVEAFEGLLDQMSVPPDLSAWITRLRDHDWAVIIVSAGCQWYIDRILARAGVQVTVFANPGHFAQGRLVMERPTDPEIACRQHGVDKRRIVQRLIDEGYQVAFAGDGFPDFSAACAVAANRRFARADLAQALRDANQPYRTFEAWTDVPRRLIPETNPEG